jgi:hypothetical protein
MVRLDIAYGEKLALTTDIAIMFRTFRRCLPKLRIHARPAGRWRRLRFRPQRIRIAMTFQANALSATFVSRSHNVTQVQE